MDEQEIRSKYRSIQIVPKSLAKGKGKHKGKKTVRCKCKACGKTSTVATSDLWLKLCECGERFNHSVSTLQQRAKRKEAK